MRWNLSNALVTCPNVRGFPLPPLDQLVLAELLFRLCSLLALNAPEMTNEAVPSLEDTLKGPDGHIKATLSPLPANQKSTDRMLVVPPAEEEMR